MKWWALHLSYQRTVFGSMMRLIPTRLLLSGKSLKTDQKLLNLKELMALSSASENLPTKVRINLTFMLSSSLAKTLKGQFAFVSGYQEKLVTLIQITTTKRFATTISVMMVFSSSVKAAIRVTVQKLHLEQNLECCSTCSRETSNSSSMMWTKDLLSQMIVILNKEHTLFHLIQLQVYIAPLVQFLHLISSL